MRISEKLLSKGNSQTVYIDWFRLLFHTQQFSGEPRERFVELPVMRELLGGLAAAIWKLFKTLARI